MSYSNQYHYGPQASVFRPYPITPPGAYDASLNVADAMPEMANLGDQQLDAFLSRWSGPATSDPVDEWVTGRSRYLREQIREILFQLQLRGALRKAVAERGKRAELDVRSKLMNLEGFGIDARRPIQSLPAGCAAGSTGDQRLSGN